MKPTFITIASYQYSAEAQIAKGRLEADGVFAMLTDTITIDTDPLVSNAIGGVKLKVYSEDETTAKAIIKSITQYSLNANGKPLKCPNCNQEHIQLFTTIQNFKALVSFIIGFVFSTLPFHTRYQYKCDDCGFEFPIK